MYAVTLIIILIIVFGWAIGFTWGGAVMCKKNNAAGMILCFLGTGLLGLLIGWVLLSKAREAEKEKQTQAEQAVRKAQDIKREEANKEDKEVIKDLLKQNQELLEELKKKDNNSINESSNSLIEDSNDENQENRKII